MSQYRTGTVTVTNGSAVVTGEGTLWDVNVSVSDIFKVENINTTYKVLSVDSDTQITLTSNWAGSTLTVQNYQMIGDFTDNFSLSEVWLGDKDWQYHLTETLREIDRLLYWLYDRVASSATTTTTTTTTSSTSTTTTTSP